MTVTANWFRRVGVLVLVGTSWFGAGNAFAVNYEDQLQPIPSSTAPMTQAATGGQSQGSATQENASASTDESDFCGLALCGPPGRFWLRADYLMWWTSGMQLPPLVTTSPQGTPQAQAGVLGQPGTSILFGNQTVNTDGRSGVRTTIGMWLDACHVWNLEFDYLTLGSRENSFTQTSTGVPILARPFFDVQGNAQASELIAFPGVIEGTVTAQASEYFQSAGVLVSYNLCSNNSCGEPCETGEAIAGMNCCPLSLNCCRTDLLMGFRYFSLGDHLSVHEALDVSAGDLVGTTIDVQDHFSARNDFYGGELGLRTQIYRGRWSFDVLAKVAMGNTRQVATIDGQTVVSIPGQPVQRLDGGLLALGTNSGTFQRDVFTVIPQLNLELGYQLGCHWRAYVGYDLLFWGDVWRSGNQVDLNIDPRNLPPVQAGGLPFPAFPGRSTSFWAQGINVGTEFRF